MTMLLLLTRWMLYFFSCWTRCFEIAADVHDFETVGSFCFILIMASKVSSWVSITELIKLYSAKTTFCINRIFFCKISMLLFSYFSNFITVYFNDSKNESTLLFGLKRVSLIFVVGSTLMSAWTCGISLSLVDSSLSGDSRAFIVRSIEHRSENF